MKSTTVHKLCAIVVVVRRIRWQFDPPSMTTVDNHPRPAPRTDDIYDPDDVGLQNSPLLKPMKPRLEPSPSPPPSVPLPPVSPDSSPEPDDRKVSSRPKYRPSPGDAVLVSFMADGKHLDVARDAGDKPLASDPEEAEEHMKGTVVTVVEHKEDREVHGEVVEVSREKDVVRGSMDLAAIAAGAVGILAESAQASYDQAQRDPTPRNDGVKVEQTAPGDPMEDVKHTIPSISSIKPLYVNASIAQSSVELAIKPELMASPTEELPPILSQSPKSGLPNGNNSNQITLPSISESIGDINHLPEPPPAADSPYAQSPPGRPPPRFSVVPGHAHGSPPKSPNDAFRRELPSPGRSSFYYNAHRRTSQTDGPPQYTSAAADYSSSNTETPSTDQSGSTPATIGIDRMSIDGITNPQIGGFQCTYPGCTAQPFQTQYLLNSHANVHSSIRPHYCSVKGCPRSEGGKGFKRKNEMIRHGLVHDSPGYVCPFCPDREHKYPRPDNLQRHVRVHHVDKDKDDPQLREVLSQRPEGPSRGRRRRGGTS